MDTEVFEIREYLDEEGNEIRSEVLSMKDALDEIEKSRFAERLNEFADKAAKQAADNAPAKKTEKASPSPSDRIAQMLDEHDWEGINARAAEIEAENARQRAQKEKTRGALEGGGWKKGFLGGSSASRKQQSGATAPADKPQGASATSGRERGSESGGKQVRFQLPEAKGRAEREGPAGQKELERLMLDNGFGAFVESSSPLLAEEKASSQPGRQEPSSSRSEQPAAFTGTISEREARPAEPSSTTSQSAAPPRMSKFKARRLGLLRDEDEETN